MHALYGRRQGNEFPLTFEVGPGRQLGFLLQQVNAKAFAQYDNVQVWQRPFPVCCIVSDLLQRVTNTFLLCLLSVQLICEWD